MKLLATLCHKNVIEFREWYETTQHIWVITELASGGSLAELLLQDGSMTLESLPAFVEDIVSGLNYLHSRNIVHCDLQPEKVGVDGLGGKMTPLICLGLAHSVYLCTV